MIRSISTQQLTEHLEDADFVIVDVREMAAFNGWTLHGEARGGHLPGAVAFPLRWLDVHFVNSPPLLEVSKRPETLYFQSLLTGTGLVKWTSSWRSVC
jgi:3-mercaptopyruvate sulfurtransferase SseA